ncbi:VWA domain-containing protein [Chlorobaculum sp. MV4-Y]|uniref:vWA domain-containing protein n=1 Tax=Chlorobaculum sp. MV4-Y TaxID=2976335 RepID=UPI0021B01D41|nr:VWA domain-containing protein [Chlorobaculum sp. MV4-Y]UWX57630.1 VWA domain-containing protein [Chlorobaculum sp. MV4-Y]
MWLLVPLAVLVFYGVRRKLSAWAKIDATGGVSGILPAVSARKLALRRIMLLLSAALMIVSIAGPQLCSGQKPVRQKGIDIIFMLDISNSMLARDTAPDRLTRAKTELLQISRSLGDGRKALLLFAGTPVVQCPLTDDKEDFEILLDMATPELITTQGTDYRRAFDAALKLTNSGGELSGNETVMVLASDGEDHGNDLGDIATTMKTRGVHLHVIGLGGVQPVSIPTPGGPKRDRQGKIVLTSFRSERLASLIKTVDGKFYYSRPDAPVHDAVADDIAAEAADARWIMAPGQRVPVHGETILAALLLFVSGSMMTDVRRPPKQSA